MPKLFCLVVGHEESPFSVNIAADETVDDLKKLIKEVLMYQFPAKKLQLYQAVKGLSRGEAEAATLDNDGKIPGCIKMDELLRIQNDAHFGMNFEPQEGNIYVLVVVPDVAATPLSPSVVWVVNVSVENALDVKGVHSRVYRMADLNHGYYDPNHPDAFVYDDKKLMVHILFEIKEKALDFATTFQNESQTVLSPLNHRTIVSNVDHTFRPSNQVKLRRVKFGDYDPSSSPEETISEISTPSAISYLDQHTEGFRYQRIEHVNAFGHTAKAQKVQKDPNNMLALSRTMHGWFDALDTDFPLFKLDVESWKEQPSVNGRYKVILKVTAASHECKDDVFDRLKEGFERTNDPLAMNTFVHVEDLNTFQFCLQWKSKEIQKNWDSYFSMNSAIS
ncbi:unnamed protein product [Aphanomyces euteiches]